MKPLFEAAEIAIRDCLGVKKDETLLILTDTPRQKIGQALFEVGKTLARESLYLEIQPRRINGEEPPPPAAEIMKQVDVVICPTTTSFTHTRARREACQAGTRVGTMPGITEEIMIRTMRADYHKIARLTEQVSKILTEGKVAHLTTPLGSDLVIPIHNISAISSTGLVLNKGGFGNLPSGESYLMPAEGQSEGVYYVDGSLAGIGLITDQPVKITVEKGMAVKIEGGQAAQQLLKMIESVGEAARNLAELGVGTNYMAQITGTILEDEKVMGTVHLALGNNVSMGGTVNVGFHVDGIIKNPTLKIDDQYLLKEGKLLVDKGL